MSFQKNTLEHKNRSTHRGETRGADEEPHPLQVHVGEKRLNNQIAEKKNTWCSIPVATSAITGFMPAVTNIPFYFGLQIGPNGLYEATRTRITCPRCTNFRTDG